MADKKKLNLGKGAAFVKSRLKPLRQSDDTWEADFRALPQPIMQTKPQYLGVVITKQDGSLLGDLIVHGRPSINDLATLLAHAMRRPLDGDARRPKLIRLRGQRQWQELFPVLQKIGIEVSIERNLPGIGKAYRALVQEMREERRARMVRPSPEQTNIEAIFPAIAMYVRGHGFIEIGDEESFGFVVRAIGHGGLDFEADTPETLAEAMTILEAGLVRWFEGQSH